MDNIKANQTQKMDGLVLLSKIKDETIKLAFFDPQYRGGLDKVKVGDGSINLKAMIDERFFGDNFRYLTKDDEDYLPSDFCYLDEFKTIKDDEFIIEDGTIYKEGEPITFFSEDLKTYEVVEIDSAEDLVKELEDHYVGEKLGGQVAKWLGYENDVLYGYHDGSEFMGWYLYNEDDEIEDNE